MKSLEWNKAVVMATVAVDTILLLLIRSLCFAFRFEYQNIEVWISKYWSLNNLNCWNICWCCDVYSLAYAVEKVLWWAKILRRVYCEITVLRSHEFFAISVCRMYTRNTSVDFNKILHVCIFWDISECFFFFFLLVF